MFNTRLMSGVPGQIDQHMGMAPEPAAAPVGAPGAAMPAAAPAVAPTRVDGVPQGVAAGAAMPHTVGIQPVHNPVMGRNMGEIGPRWGNVFNRQVR
jgi:hypothetical protein